MKNSKFKVKPLFVLAVTALILLVTAISTVTYAWIETGNNLVIKTADAANNSANVSVVNRAGYARNMAKNTLSSVINLNEYVDYRNLYFAPAKGEMIKADGAKTTDVSEASDVKVSINDSTGSRPVVPEDISTNYIDFEIKVKNNDKTHSDIKFANSDDERIVVIDGVDVSKAKFGVAVIATGEGGTKVINTDSERLLKETPSFGTLYPHEELTLRVKIWLMKEYADFTEAIAGKPITLNLSLIMTDPKTTTFKFADKTSSFEELGLLELGQAGGYKLFAVNGGNTDEKYELTAESTNADGVTTMSGMPEFLLYGHCANDHTALFTDQFQLWAYEDGDLTKDPVIWNPGFKPPLSADQTALDAYTDTYTIYGDLKLRSSESVLRGTWQKVVEVELRDHSIEKIFTDESIRMVTLYNGIISYPMYRNRVQNSVGEMEPTNALTSYMPGYIFTKSDIGQIHFNSRVTDNCEGTHNLWGTVRANNRYTEGKVGTQDKYVFSVFGFSGTVTDTEDYCFGEWYSGDVDKITLQDVTTGRRIQTDYSNNSKQMRVSYKGNCGSSNDGLGESFYLAYFDKDAKCWYTTLPSGINPHAGDKNDNLVQFSLNANDNNDKVFKACDRVQTNGEYVYHFINEYAEAGPFGSWTYNLADDTVIYVQYRDGENTTSSETLKFYNNLYVWQLNVDPVKKPLGDWDSALNKSGIEEGNYKVFYINKYDFDIGSDNAVYGETFAMKAYNSTEDSTSDIKMTADGKPLYVGGRYRIDADGTVTELASFGYVRPQQTIVADVNEVCSLPAAVDFQDPGTNITYSYALSIAEGEATQANVTQLSISSNAADYGQLTFQANKAGEYTVTVTASAADGASVKTAIKKFIFKVGLNPRITIADNVNVESVTFKYTDEYGNARKLVKGSSAKILQGTVLTGNAATMNKYSYLRFNNGYTATLADGTTTDITESGNYEYTVTKQAAVIDVKVKNSDNPYIICGENKWEGITQTDWTESINMTYDRDRNTVFADIKKTTDDIDADIKIVRDGNTDGHRDDDNYCVNYGKPQVKVSVPGVTARIDNGDKNLVISGVNNGDSIRVEYDITNNIIYIRQTRASIDVKLFAVPEFEKAQVSVTAKGQDAAIIKAGKNEGTGTAYEGNDVTLSQIVNNADFNSYSVDYFTVEFKNSDGDTVGDILTVRPGDKFTMPTKTEDPETNVVLVEITTHINKDDTPFYVAGSADNINWQTTKTAMTVTDNVVSGYVTVDGIGENGECFIRIAKGSYKTTAFQQVNTSVTMSKAGRPNVYVESDSSFPATHEQQSIRVVKPGIVKQTFKVTYDLGNHRMTVSAPLYFQNTLETMSVTKGVTTKIVIGALLPNSSSATYSTKCSDVDAEIGGDETAAPTFTSSNNNKDYKVVTTATVSVNGVDCYASKTFNVDVNDLVDITIKKHDQFAISGVTVTATHTPSDGVESTYTPSASDVTFRAAVGDTVTLTLDIPNDKFNGFYADKDNNFTITDGSNNAVNKNFTTNYTIATFTVPVGGATVTPTPAQHNSMTYYLTGDSNAVDGVSWADTDGYDKTFTYDKNTNTITYPNAVLKGNKIANIKISRGGYKSGETNQGRDDDDTSISYTEGMKFDWSGAPLSVSKVSVTDDEYKDIRIEGVFNANNPKRVNITYYLAEHKLVITDSETTGTIMTEDLLAVLRKQKVMFYFGIKGETAGYLNKDNQSKGENNFSFLSSMTYNNVSYNYAPVCLPSIQYYIAQNTEWSGKEIGEAAQAGKAYLLNMNGIDNNVVTAVESSSGCTVPNTSFPVNLTETSSIVTGVKLNSSTSVTGAANSLTYYITDTPITGDTYPTIGTTTTFKPFDPSNLKQLSEGNYIIVPVVGDGSILVRGEEIKLKISDKTIVNVDVTVENNVNAIVKATSGPTTINEKETKQLQAGDEVTITAQIENSTFNSYTRVQSFDIVNATTGNIIKTVPANNNSATFTVPEVDVTIKANLIQSDTVKYYITGENIDGIDYWGKNDTNANQLMTFDPEKNIVTKEIKITNSSVQFKISKNSLGDSFIDNPLYAISEATPQPTLKIAENLTDVNFNYVTIDFNGEKHNFQLSPKSTDGSLQGRTVLITYDLSAHTVTVSEPSNDKPKHKVTITPISHAEVTATYTNAAGTLITINEGDEGAQVDEGTELTLNCAIENPDFNSYNFASYTVTGATLSGSKLTVGKTDITVDTNLGRDTTSSEAKFYLTGTGLKAGGNTLSWSDTKAEMSYDKGANTVSIPVTLTESGAMIKISKGGYVSGENNVGRDNKDYSVTLEKTGRANVTVDNKATDIVTHDLTTSGAAIDRCLVLTYANGVSGEQNIKLTYDLDTNTITIDKVVPPQNVGVTLNEYSNGDAGITVKASYGSGSVTTITAAANVQLVSGTALTLTATIPNADFNSYKFNGFKVVETKSDSITNNVDVALTDGKYIYTLPDTGVTAVSITADITQTDPALKLAHRAGTSGAWSVKDLVFDSATNTATGTFNVTTASDKYFTISNSDASKTVTLTSTDVTDNSTYAAYENTGKSVKVTLPAGLTQQPLKFTYDLKTNKVTVDAPVKFSDLTDNAISTTKNTAVTLQSTATKLSGESGTITYSTVCTSSNKANVTIGSATSATPTFSASADGTYTVTTTATIGGFVAVKTYTVTVKSTVVTKPADNVYVEYYNSGHKKIDTTYSSTNNIFSTSAFTFSNFGELTSAGKFRITVDSDPTSSWTDKDSSTQVCSYKRIVKSLYPSTYVKFSSGILALGSISASDSVGDYDDIAINNYSLLSGKSIIIDYMTGVDHKLDGTIGIRLSTETSPLLTGTTVTTSNVTITNNTGYTMTAVCDGSAVEIGSAVALKRGKEVTLTVAVPNAKFNSKSATFSGVDTTDNGTNSVKFTVPANNVTVTAGITQPDTYPFSLCGEGASEFTSWGTAVAMTYSKENNTVTGTINVGSSGTAKIKIVKGSDVAETYRDSADYSVTVEGNNMHSGNISTTVGTVAFEGLGKDRNIQLTGASGKKVTITYNLENNTVAIAEDTGSSSGESTTKTITLTITGEVLSADNSAKSNYRAVFKKEDNTETSQFLNYSTTNSYTFTVPDNAKQVKFQRVKPTDSSETWNEWGYVNIDSTKTTFKVTGWSSYEWA